MLLIRAFPCKADFPVATWRTLSFPWGPQELFHIHWPAQPKPLWLLDRHCWDWDLDWWHTQEPCLPWASPDRQGCSNSPHLQLLSRLTYGCDSTEDSAQEQSLRVKGGTCVPSGPGDRLLNFLLSITVIWLPQDSGSWLQRKYLRQLAWEKNW